MLGLVEITRKQLLDEFIVFLYVCNAVRVCICIAFLTRGRLISIAEGLDTLG